MSILIKQLLRYYIKMRNILIGVSIGILVFTLIIYNFNGNERTENYTGGKNISGELYPEKCINGIVYYNQGTALAIAGKPNGMFYTCTRKEK